MRGFVTDCDCYLSDIVPLHVHVPSEADIFGVHSKLVTGETGMPQPIEQLSWVENYTYEGLVIAIFILFCYLLYNFRGDILQLLRFLAMHTSSEKIYAEQKLFFKRFINLSTPTGNPADLWPERQIMRLLRPRWKAAGNRDPANVNLIPVILLLIPGIILLYRYLVTGIVGAVTRNQAFFKSYRFMSHLSGSVSFLILTPFFLLFALGDGNSTTFFIYLTITIVAALYLLYLGKSYRFFIERNVSILQWILYLCTVEWFPVSSLCR